MQHNGMFKSEQYAILNYLDKKVHEIEERHKNKCHIKSK